MSKALDELEYMMVVCENPPQSFLDNKEHYREVLNEALIEVAIYMRENHNDDFMKTVAEDLNSPVRKFVNFVCANVSRMHAILSSHGVESPDEPLTKEILDEHNIVDLFGLYQIEYWFRHPWQYTY